MTTSSRSGCRLVAGFLFRRAPFMAWSLELGTRIRRHSARKRRAPSGCGTESRTRKPAPTRQVCHRTRSPQGRFAPLKRWPPKAAAILDCRSHGGSAEMRSGRKNGSAGVKQKNERQVESKFDANFSSARYVRAIQGRPSRFLLHNRGLLHQLTSSRSLALACGRLLRRPRQGTEPVSQVSAAPASKPIRCLMSAL